MFKTGIMQSYVFSPIWKWLIKGEIERRRENSEVLTSLVLLDDVKILFCFLPFMTSSLWIHVSLRPTVCPSLLYPASIQPLCSDHISVRFPHRLPTASFAMATVCRKQHLPPQPVLSPWSTLTWIILRLSHSSSTGQHSRLQPHFDIRTMLIVN